MLKIIGSRIQLQLTNMATIIAVRRLSLVNLLVVRVRERLLLTHKGKETMVVLIIQHLSPKTRM